MNNAFYITLSRQKALFKQMGVIANNIANSSTSGYKSEKMLFSNLVKKDANGEKISFSHDIGTIRDMRQGELLITGSNLDVAIQGEGFFIVDTEAGEKYTRAGSLSRNASGELVTSNGGIIKGSGGGPLTIPDGATDLNVRQDGMVQVFVANVLEEVGRIKIVKFADELKLVSIGNGLFEGEGSLPANQEDFKIVNGAIEQSNVNAVQEMTRMIEVSRSVGTTAQYVKDLHNLVRKAIETISKQA